MKTRSFSIKVLAFFLIAVFTLVIYAKFNTDTDKFSQARDFPKGALVYVQISDLPKIVELWDKSKIKENYLKSVNYKDLTNQHLILKIAERWKEFDSAFAIPFEFDQLNNISETKAAIAVYDIGKLDFIFIAPISKEKILASYFFKNHTGFEENKLENGDVFYSKQIEIDRGRQVQKLLFASIKGRLIFATNEILFFHTLANLNATSKKGNLAEEADFVSLSKKLETHLATVWVNQTKLNNDWYFKQYWLMNNLEELKSIRAGIFDFELQENKLIEHRLFLNSKDVQKRTSNISVDKINSLRNLIPKEVPFYKVESVNKKDSIRKFVHDTLLDNNSIPTPIKTRQEEYYFYDDLNYRDTDYSYLYDDFDMQINDAEDADADVDLNEEFLFRSKIETELLADFEKTINLTDPQFSVYLLDPHKLKDSMFLKIGKAFMISLKNSKNLDKNALEKSISKLLQNRLTVTNSNSAFEWNTKQNSNFSIRQISTPFIDWKFFYSIQNDVVIFSNDEEFLIKILSNNKDKISKLTERPLSELKVINFKEREKVFDNIMKSLVDKYTSEETRYDFFVDNIGSLLDVMSDVDSIEIERLDEGEFSQETINYILNKAE